MFDDMLNWRLLSGSHKLPGPEGGTCISEAAIVAAGFSYRAVYGRGDCPPCFSPVIASYAIRLNDATPDDLRQQLLMPFVTRFAGTADTSEKEIERARYIAIQIIKRILPNSPLARPTEQTAEFDAAHNTAARFAAWAAEAAKSVARAADAAYVAADAIARYAVAVDNASACRTIFVSATAILDEAIKLGNQAPPLERALVVSRMEAIKQSALNHV